MRCREARAAVLRESDEALGLDESFLLDEHVAACPRCRRFRALELAVREGLAVAPEPAVPDGAVEGATRAVRAALEAGAGSDALPPERSARGWPRRLAVAAGLAALVAVGWRLLRPEPPAAPGTAAPEVATEAADTAGAPERPQRPTPARASLDAAPLDAAEVRRRVGAVLALVAAAEPGQEGVPTRAELFRRHTAELARSWPVVRFVEDFVTDADPSLARAAAEVLGTLGDGISVPALRDALGRAAVAPVALDALARLGPAGVPGLAAALRRPALAPRALSALSALGGDEAAAALEASYVERGADPARDAAWLEALAACGAAGFEPLLALAERDPARRTVHLAWLARVPDASARLAARLRRPDGLSEELLLAATLSLPSDEAVRWLEERCWERATRGPALDTLARLEGGGPLAAAVRLALSGRVPEAELESLVARLLDEDPGRAAPLARRLTSSGADDPAAARALLELLLACGAPGTGEALCALARADVLEREERIWAALAAGELGGPEDEPFLAEDWAAAPPDERRLRAAIVLSVHALAGSDGVARLVEARPGGPWRRLSDVLADADGRGAAVQLHRVARALDDLTPPPADPWRTP